MELNAYTRTIRTLFSTNVKYVVPRFQREYSWSKEEVNELWLDLLYNIKVEDGQIINSEYFIGSLVLIGEDKSTSLLIVDGQQRLTTITILLSALVQTFNDIEQKDLAEGIYNTYIEGKDDRNKPFFKLVNENPKPFLQESIQHIIKKTVTPSSKEERTLWDAYLFFSNKMKLDSLKKEFRDWNNIGGKDNSRYLNFLEALREQILSYLKVIYITVNNEDDAYMIFETLNARGKSLTSVDLIKNDLFKILNSAHPDDTAKTKWKKIQSNLTSRNQKINIEVFFRHYWLSKYNFVTESKIYKSFKKESNNVKFKHLSFLENLVKESDIYNKIANPLKTDWPDLNDKQIFLSLDALNLFQISQIRAFLLALLIQREKRLVSHSDFSDFMLKMENFHFKYTAICSLKMNIFEGKYSKAARDLRESTTKVESRIILSQITDFYKQREPKIELFGDQFKKVNFTNQYTKDKKFIQYIFMRFESFLRKTNELTINNISLEHIDSQSNNGEKVGNIGNLLPLDKVLNERASDKKFTDKLKVYSDSNLEVVKYFLSLYKDTSNWDISQIDNWFETIKNKAYYEIWLV